MGTPPPITHRPPAGHAGPALQKFPVGRHPCAPPQTVPSGGAEPRPYGGQGVPAGGAAKESAKRRQWRKKRADFEEVPRLADTSVDGNRMARRWATAAPYGSSTGKRRVGGTWRAVGRATARVAPTASPLPSYRPQQNPSPPTFAQWYYGSPRRFAPRNDRRGFRQAQQNRRFWRKRRFCPFRGRGRMYGKEKYERLLIAGSQGHDAYDRQHTGQSGQNNIQEHTSDLLISICFS